MKLPMAEKERLYIFRDDRLTVLDSPLARPLRWAAWQPDGSWCLLVGNGGTAVRYASNGRFEPIATGTKHNLRGAAFSPDGAQALLVGNRGAVLLLDPSTLRPGSGQASLRAGRRLRQPLGRLPATTPAVQVRRPLPAGAARKRRRGRLRRRRLASGR